MKKSLVCVVSLLVIVSLLAACAPKATPTAVPPTAVPQPTKPAERQTTANTGKRYPKLTVALNADPKDLMPINYNSPSRGDIFQQVFEPLFDFEKGDYLPLLAKSYKVIDDTHWQVPIYDYIYDSAGNHITADDVVFSYNYAVESKTVVKYFLFKSVKKVDNYTVEFEWTGPVNVVGGLEHPWCRTMIFSEKAFKASNFATNPVGTGTYVVKEFVSGSKIVLEANDKYWQTDASKINYRHQRNVQTIEYLVIPESAQQVLALQSGTIDFSPAVPAASLADFQDGGKYGQQYDVYSKIERNQYILSANSSENSAFSDINLRLAAFYAIDNEAVAKIALGAIEPAKALGSPGNDDYLPAWEQQKTYVNTFDPAKAKEYLAKASYKGQSLVFLTTTQELYKNMATAIQSFLANVGINVELKLVDPASTGNLLTDPKSFDLYLHMIGGGFQVGSWNRVLNNNEFKNGMSIGFIHDETMQKLFETANTAAGHTAENMTKVHDHIIQNAYHKWIGYGKSSAVYTNKIADLVYREGNTVLPGSCTYYLD